MMELICPNCNNVLVKVIEPDIEYEKCLHCSAVFLHKEELNALATGHSGDVSLHYIYGLAEKDKREKRKCPLCQIKMNWVRFGQFAEIYFEHCEKCNGYFIIENQIEQINTYLTSLTDNHISEEFRDYFDEILVRVDITEESSFIETSRVGQFVQPRYNIQYNLEISAFFSKPLEIDLLMTQENRVFRFLKLLFGFHKHEKTIGNAEFDSRFSIYTNNESLLRTIINHEVIELVNEFTESNHANAWENGKLKFFDDRVLYKEGKYNNVPAYEPNMKFSKIINELVKIAKTISLNNIENNNPTYFQ